MVITLDFKILGLVCRTKELIDVYSPFLGDFAQIEPCLITTAISSVKRTPRICWSRITPYPKLRTE